MITNITRQTTIASKAITARTPWQSMKGLLGREFLPSGEALVLPRCQSIHMVFMKFPIDVIFCDRRHRVVGLCPGIRPFCFSPMFFNASFAIELPTGTISASKTLLGDQIALQ